MLRIIVFSLLLANILLVALRMLQPDPEASGGIANISAVPTPLPGIELVAEGQKPAGRSGAEESDKPDRVIFRSLEADFPTCVRIGPFVTETASMSFQSELEGQFDRVQARETQSIVDKGFWVHLPPYASRAEAAEVVDQMTVAGASEFYIVPQGPMENAVSLGVYQRRERAEERRQQIQGLGLALEIMINQQTDIESQYWLEAGPVDAMNPSLIQLSVNHPGVEHLQIPCSGEAPEMQPAADASESVAEEIAQDEQVQEN